jgi:hypothetical protein
VALVAGYPNAQVNIGRIKVEIKAEIKTEIKVEIKAQLDDPILGRICGTT